VISRSLVVTASMSGFALGGRFASRLQLLRKRLQLLRKRLQLLRKRVHACLRCRLRRPSAGQRAPHAGTNANTDTNTSSSTSTSTGSASAAGSLVAQRLQPVAEGDVRRRAVRRARPAAPAEAEAIDGRLHSAWVTRVHGEGDAAGAAHGVDRVL